MRRGTWVTPERTLSHGPPIAGDAIRSSWLPGRRNMLRPLPNPRGQGEAHVDLPQSTSAPGVHRWSNHRSMRLDPNSALEDASSIEGP
jgi:hypothetical protein